MSLGSEIFSVDGRCFGTESSRHWTRDNSRSGRIEKTERMVGGIEFEPSTVLSRCETYDSWSRLTANCDATDPRTIRVFSELHNAN